jgi:hypothetical protein
MEMPAFTKANLSNIRVIMAIMRVLMKQLLCQVVTGWILILKCLLPGVIGHLWLRPIKSGIKWRYFLRTQL